MKRIIGSAFLILLLVGCSTTAQVIRRPNGTREYLITCGGVGWKACYEKANQVCPGGYATVSENGGVFSNELRIACPSAK